MTTAQSKEIFVRSASGLVRDWSLIETTIYNVLTIGLYAVLIAGLYYTGPGAFPGADIPLAVIITVFFGCIHSTNYALLGTSMPRSGGEYVFLTRVLNGGFGVAIELGAWIFWQWIYMYWNAWAFTYLGVYILCLNLGGVLNNPGLIGFGTWAGTSQGLMVIGILYCAACVLFGMLGPTRNYMRLQWLLIIGTVTGFLTSAALFASVTPATFQQMFNAFMLKFQSDPNFYTTIINTAKSQGYQIPGFSLAATFALVPMAYTQLCWGWWSSWNLGEIKGSDRVKNNIIAMLGSTIIVGIFLLVMAYAIMGSAGYLFLGSAGFLTANGSPVMAVLPQPLYFPFLAGALTLSPILAFLIGFGGIANGINYNFNVGFAFTRVLVTSSLDRVVPERLGRVSMKTTQPMYAWLLLLAGGIVVFIVQGYTSLGSFFLNSFYSSMVAFALVGLAAMILPFRRPDIFNSSPIAKWKIGKVPIVTLTGLVGVVFNLVMVYYYVTTPVYGMGIYAPSLLFIIGVFVICYIYYLIRRTYLKSKGMDVTLAFKEIPPA